MASQKDMRIKNGEADATEIGLPDHPDSHSSRRFPVVGVGASAGGLDAFKALLAKLPPDTGMAFVLIQHLDPLHVSLMGGLLASHTAMPVNQAADGVLIEPNRVYLIPPAVSLAVRHGKLQLSEPAERHGARMAFDFFLRSLAEDYGDRAFCVVLSGTGSDGSEGLKAVKANGGFVLVQKPSEAAFDGMPKSAIQTGQADLILPVAEIPEALVKLMNRVEPNAQPDANEGLKARFTVILELVRKNTNQDFSLYKTGTLTRRIQRRMALAGITNTGSYIEKLSTDAAELKSLGHDLLINVTQFFRDVDSFDALLESAIREMVAAHPIDRPMRIWVPGCSTGEEAYSLAIVFFEAIAASKRPIKLQVFASDVDVQSIALARAGLYGRETESQVSPKRLEQFFTRQGDGFRVARELREAVIFTVQDLLVDPPFSRLDLISCRNMLIYLQTAAQEQILSLFHFALRAGGVLFLGRSETVGKFAERFKPIDKKQRIFRHVSAGRPSEIDFRSGWAVRERLAPLISAPFRKTAPHVNLGDIAAAQLLATFAPPSVLVDKKWEALFYSGAVDQYLQLTPGEANGNILVMARDGLRSNLRAALENARDSGELASKTGARLNRDGSAVGVRIVAKPIPSEEILLVSFIEEAPPETEMLAEDASRVVQLEQELDLTRKDLSATIRDLQVSNEDLRGVHEEALSINEEFQSANEELETSKEELQALNEELTALNSQLQETLEHQRSTSTDLQNILNSSDVATIFLDPSLNIRFFTPATKSLFGVSNVDIGRPLADLAQRFQDDALVLDVHAVLSKLAPVRREIESQDGNWYIRSVLPYQSDSDASGGVVITFTRISEMKAAERKIEAARSYAESIIGTVKQPLVVLDEDLLIDSASAAFFRVFDLKPEDSVGKPFGMWGKLQHGEPWAAFIASIHAHGAIENLEVDVELPDLGGRTLLVNAREIVGQPEHRKILVSLDDITDAKAEAGALAVAKEEAERANLAKSRFLAAASHDLRQPLQTMSLLQGMLADEVSDPTSSKLIKRLQKTIGVMSSLLDDLLNINQLEAGVIKPEFSDFVVDDLLRQLQSEFELQAGNQGLALRAVPCHRTVRSDPRLLEQILRNMLSNSTKYTSRGKVLLGCRLRGDRLSIEVWDTGSGIPETELGEIFKEFHQLEQHSGKKTKGLGLGLAIVQRIADLIEAPISVRSRLGLGSVFSVQVPMVAAPAPPDLPDERPEANAGPRSLQERAQTILIVEDEPEVRDTLQLVFESRGYRIFAARDGSQALHLAADRGVGIDLIIADYNLPGLNGLEVASKVEEITGRKIPVILLTGDISAATLREIAEKKHLHLYKPVDGQTLIRHVNGLLSRNTNTPTIFVVDDDHEVREALRDMLERHGLRTEIFADGASFLKVCSPARTGCLLADARMPGLGGLKLIERVAEMQPSLPAIVITAYGDVAMAVTAMKAGAFDFLQKPVCQNDLLDCIKRALTYSNEHPGVPVDRKIAVAKIESLTKRQRQILALVLAGMPSKNIAADMRISQRTVDNHRAAIMRKAGAKSLSALIRVALAAA